MTHLPARPALTADWPDCRARASVAIPMGLENVVADFIGFDGLDGKEHVALRFQGRRPATGEPPLVRLHSECLTGDVFASARCDCGHQLHEALGLLAEEGGILLYLRQEGRGIGLYAKLDAYRLQDTGLDTYAANRQLNLPEDGRDYGVAAAMLKALEVPRIRLLTNNPDKVAAMQASGIEVASVRRTGIYVTEANRAYLQAKFDRGHMFPSGTFRVPVRGQPRRDEQGDTPKGD